MGDILESAGAGTAAGGFITWLISYVKNKDIKEQISKRVHKDTYNADHAALHDKINLIKDTYNADQAALHDKVDLISTQQQLACSIRTNALEQRLDDFKDLQTKMDLKLDKLIERRNIDRE